MRHRLTRWCFPGTLAVAGLFSLLLLLGCWLEAPEGNDFWGRLGFILLADPAMRKTLAISILGLTLTAFLFFRKPKINRPILTRTLDV
jgi:hypothetical protein